jgi:uroporphyrinogen III methyltransferase/synthase
MAGKVWLVGAGPGDLGLFTIKGLEVLQKAEVVVYDALIGDAVLTLIPDRAEKINVGKRAGNHRMTQEQINLTLLEQAQAGKRVVRLKGGDPFLFGRGGEELELLVEHDVPYEIVPGVTSAFAVPAYNGIPVTHRDFTSSVHIITGHRRSSANTHSIGRAEASRNMNTAGSAGSLSDSDGLGIDYEALVRTKGTLIFLMGLSTLPVIMRGLLDAGISPDTPAAVLERGTTAGQRRVLATVSTLEEETDRARIKAPAIIVVGEVCRLAESFAWAEKRPLAGRKILLTRPKELISEMAGRLRRMGAEVLEMPAIETVPIQPNPALEDCFQKDPKGAAYSQKTAGRIDWMVFTSPAGVRIFMDWFLPDHDIRDLAGIRIAAIGEGSAKKLRQYGIRCDFVPTVYDGETLGRELAQEIRQEREAHNDIPAAVRVLIPRAAIGSRELVEELEKAGDIEILDIPTYTTEYVNRGIVDAREQIEKGEIHYAVFTSASTVRGFSAVMEDADLSGIKAICIGRQTRAAAQAQGMETRMAEKATLDALLDAVVQCAAEDRT